MSLPTVLVLNGPNLNLLGVREPEIYGRTTLADIEEMCTRTAAEAGLSVRCLQSNHEGDLIDAVHEARETTVGAIINAGAYTHTSLALHDALKSYDHPIIEVHLSNPHARESFRHHSFLSPAATAVVAGAGAKGYVHAMEILAEDLDA
ncbi:type II 3-dehydroquinate dehydratase [Brevibacterium marinum]|uniref:3-dehydroquinate dehydratase n=1 Tax=Brevibacterium marinum TaxID=418643 RepID=A0A846S3K9_9MICO|nr:3-dehydroquinate dehydratase-2 [Brevibacterium marinum]